MMIYIKLHFFATLSVYYMVVKHTIYVNDCAEQMVYFN
jgi:hypothetical protein